MIIAAPFSAIIMVGEFVLPEVIRGMDRGIDHPKPLDAAHAKALVQHRHGIAVDAHPRGADGMEDRGADLAGGPAPGLPRDVKCAPGLYSSGLYLRQRRRGHDAADELERIGGDPPVLLLRQVVRRDRGRLGRVGAYRM